MAMIRPETEMKDSGIEYVGAISKDWDLVRLRAYFGERKNKNKDSNETNLLSLSYGRIIRKNIDKTDGLLPASFNTYNIVEKNDIIIRPTDLQNDKRSLRTGLVTEHGIITSAYIDLMPIGNVDSRFVHYLLHSYDILKVFYNMGSGVRQGLNYSEFSKLKVPMPLLSEQKVIADYLDETCSKIDEIIAEAKVSIDEYKELKQSVIFEAVTKGLDKNVETKEIDGWIRWLPKGWNFRKINGLFNVIGSGTTPKSSIEEYYQGTINWLQSGDINGTVVKNTKKHISDEIVENTSALVVYDAPFIAIAMYGASIGNISIVDINACTNQACCVLSQPTKDIDMGYSFWCIMSAKEELLLSSRGGGQPNISQNIIKQLRIPLPPLMEQRKIADYLSDKTKEIDSLIAEKESLINDLEAYKKSLIYEVVTGKRRVV